MRRVEGDTRAAGIERLDAGWGGLVLVADFGEGANRGAWLLAGNPIHAFDFAYCLSENIVLADDDAVLLRVDEEDVEGLAGSKAEAFALTDGKILNAAVTSDQLAALAYDFTFSVL